MNYTKQQGDDYCYWDIRDRMDFVIVCINLTIVTIYITWTVINRKIYKFFSTKKPIQIKYLEYFVIAWFICYAAEFIYALAINAWRDLPQKYQISKQSSIYQCLDFFPAFIIMGCLYYLCILSFEKVQDIQSKNIDVDFSNIERNFYLFLKFFQWFRLVFSIPSLLIVILFNLIKLEETHIKFIQKFEVGCYLLDTTLCVIVTAVTMRTLNKNKQYILEGQNLQQQFKRDRLLLIFTVLSRLVVGFVFIFLDTFQTQCPKSSPWRSIIFLLIAQNLAHVLPIYIILKIFNDQDTYRNSFVSNQSQAHLVNSNLTR